ncbi:MAG: hypothetical protein AB8F78_20060 [Saprospiraceae bacterium]
MKALTASLHKGRRELSAFAKTDQLFRLMWIRESHRWPPDLWIIKTNKMKLFELSLTGMIIRFYLMMTAILIAGFTGIWAIGLIALPIFMSALTGLEIKKAPKNVAKQNTAVAQKVTFTEIVNSSSTAIA